MSAIRPVRPALAALVAAWIAGCGGEVGTERATESTPGNDRPAAADPAPDATTEKGSPEATLLAGELPSGSPMPAADRTGGIPPYPGAIVHNRTNPNRADARAFEAFTDDPPEDVIAFYDRHLASWRRVDAADTDLWVLDPDRAAVTVSPWDYANAHPSLPPFLRQDARTVIGVAYRVDGATGGDAGPAE